MANPTPSQTLWKQVVTDYRQACVLRREGRETEAGAIIGERLPASIAAWSRADTRSASDKKSALESMFEMERASMDSWMLANESLAAQLSRTLIPALREQVAEEIRESMRSKPLTPNRLGGAPSAGFDRVRFDDIPGVIDTLLAQQQADRGPRRAYLR